MESTGVKCSICDKKSFVTFCLFCEELHCADCSRPHGHFGATKKHCTINTSSGEIRNLEQELLNCFSCKGEHLEATATFFCPVCRELMCQKCHLFHSKSRITKQHDVTTLSRDGNRTKTKASSKMADIKVKESIDDGQFSSDFEGVLHFTGATSIDLTVPQAPLSVLSSGAVTEDKVGATNNVTTQSVTNMAYVGDFDVKLDSDREECDITDIACLSDGRVVICDVYNVKVYNSDCKYLYSVECSGGLYGITVVSSNTVVVLENGTTLRYLQLDTQRGVILSKHITVSSGSLAVSYAVHTFAVLYPLPSHRHVVMINDSGVKLTDVKLTEIKGYIPHAILLDSSGSRFYICDGGNHRVNCYSCQPGHTGVLWKCSVAPNPHSVVHVGDSLVVLCQKNVHEINKSGHYLQEVVVRGTNFDIIRPVAAFQTSCRKLVVTSWGRGSKVQIFQL